MNGPEQVEVRKESMLVPRASLVRVSTRAPWLARVGDRAEAPWMPHSPCIRFVSRERRPVVTRRGIPLNPCSLASIANSSRRREGERCQRARREREHAVRERVAMFTEAAHGEGIAYRQVAQKLRLPVRTLTDWRHRLHDPHLAAWRARGRPRRESSPQARRQVLDLLDATGPRIGVPMLRRVFPEMPRCELVDLEREYRLAFRREYRVSREVLTWKRARRVWAMDHSKPPSPIDGRYGSIFSVRDLASGLQLAWLPVVDETDATTCQALATLFAGYGAPLVLKSDNGSAFASQLLQDLLARHRVTPLFSPPVTPRYNGSCEAGNGAMKVRTHEEAALAGRAGLWTSEDLEAARRHANEFYLPSETAHFTAQEIWNSTPPIHDNEREAFLQTIRDTESKLREAAASANRLPATRHQLAAFHRCVLRRALVELGLLSINRRLIALPLKRRKLARFL